MPRQSDLAKGGDAANVTRRQKTPPRTVPALQLGIAGLKRTASGTIKATDASPTKSLTHAATTDGSKTTVTEASGQNINDLTTQLQTRLSYAMLKVQRGWESHSLDEVEALTSQQASPTSLKGTLDRHPLRQSPLGAASWTSMSRQSSGLSENSPLSPFPASQRIVHGHDSLDANHLRSRPTGRAWPVNASESHGGGPLESPSSNLTSHTYESFRRGQTGTNTASAKRPFEASKTSTGNVSSAQQRPPALAPAVDLIPSTITSSHPGQQERERERPDNLHSPIHASSQISSVTSPTNSISTTVQVTPTARPRLSFAEGKRPLSLRTPSQTEKASMEQDAVETLLYMSTPGGNRIHQAPHNTPASAQYSQPQTPIRQGPSPLSTTAPMFRTPVTPRRTVKPSGISSEGDNQTKGRVASVIGKYPTRDRGLKLMPRRPTIDEEEDDDGSDDEIDRMLDAMSSSSEDD
ncbi:MAG: hypothetical protein M1816_006070 [Peltula sp. TS41687]|nr:MAG: hypothetical protein M1816_006070 [Peltula sp. TS41687]